MKNNKDFLEDENAYRCAAEGMGDHYLLEAKVRMKAFWRSEREEVTAKRVVRVSELEKEKK